MILLIIHYTCVVVQLSYDVSKLWRLYYEFLQEFSNNVTLNTFSAMKANICSKSWDVSVLLFIIT